MKRVTDGKPAKMFFPMLLLSVPEIGLRRQFFLIFKRSFSTETNSLNETQIGLENDQGNLVCKRYTLHRDET